MKKLDKLFISEILSLALVITASLSTVLFMAKMPQMLTYLFSSPDGALTPLIILFYVFPQILKLTIPISLLFSCTIVTMRMSGDGELEAWMCSGVSVARICFGPLLLGFFAMLLTLSSALFMEPHTRQEFRKIKWIQAKRLVEAMIQNKLKEKVFISDLFPSNSARLAFYAEKISKDKKNFEDVFIAVKSQGAPYHSVISAKSGSFEQIKTDSSGAQSPSDYVLKLFDGEIIQNKEPSPNEKLMRDLKKNSWTQIKYKELKISLITLFQKQLEKSASGEVDIRSLYPISYIHRLREERKESDWNKNREYIRDHTFFFEQFVIPFSCLLLPLVGIFLGFKDGRKKQTSNYLSLGVVAFLFYASLMLCEQLATRAFLDPLYTLFVPPLVLILITLILLYWRTHYPPSTSFSEFVKITLSKLYERVNRFFNRHKRVN